MQLPRYPLFVPADRPDRFAKAAASGADAVILDLEDAVSPVGKAEARAAVARRAALSVPVLVRINAADSAWHSDDLAALAAAPPEAVLVPKAGTDSRIPEIRTALGPGSSLIVLIESARGLAELPALLAMEGVVGAAFGHLDFALDLGCAPEWEPMLLARSTLVWQSRLAGLAPPIDGVTPGFDDPALVHAETARARALGFGGKLLVHPAQVAPARAALSPTPAERAWAERVLAAAEAAGGGAVRLDGQMIDTPVIARAQALLASGADRLAPT